MMLTDTIWFPMLMVAVGFVASAIASVSGFGIGSLMTQILAIKAGTKLAVAAVSIPHLTETALRFWLMRKQLTADIARGPRQQHHWTTE